MSTQDEVKGIIANLVHCGEQEVASEMALADLDADSLRWLQIIIAIESTFDIEVDLDRMAEFVTIGDFVAYIDSCIS